MYSLCSSVRPNSGRLVPRVRGEGVHCLVACERLEELVPVVAGLAHREHGVQTLDVFFVHMDELDPEREALVPLVVLVVEGGVPCATERLVVQVRHRRGGFDLALRVVRTARARELDPASSRGECIWIDLRPDSTVTCSSQILAVVCHLHGRRIHDRPLVGVGRDRRVGDIGRRSDCVGGVFHGRRGTVVASDEEKGRQSGQDQAHLHGGSCVTTMS